jgi:acetyl-CoA C-acetyltransferase
MVILSRSTFIKGASVMDIYILSANRTAIGNLNGKLSSIPASRLGSHLIRELIKRDNIPSSVIREVILGQVLTAKTGQNPARQASIDAGLSDKIPAYLVNQVCGSGLQSVCLAARTLMSAKDTDNCIIAGGQESMSQAPHAINMRFGYKAGDQSMIDTMMLDSLTDAFAHYPMGITAENLAEKYHINREKQDQFALLSQTKARDNAYRMKDEIIPIEVQLKKDSYIFSDDEFPRQTTIDGLRKLKPVFMDNGTVTAGNSSGINDGAAVVVVCSSHFAQQYYKHKSYKVKIKDMVHVGVDPKIMGIGPAFAIREILRRNNMEYKDIELVELNEAFAAQALAVIEELNIDNIDNMNVNGGAIALGHPVGASGTRCLVTLINEMEKRNSSNGLVSLCIGGGMGIALLLEAV